MSWNYRGHELFDICKLWLDWMLSYKVTAPMVSFEMWPDQGCSHKENTPAPTVMEPGVEIPNQSMGRRAGIGWWWWLPATNTPTMSVDTPAWVLLLLGKVFQVSTLLLHTMNIDIKRSMKECFAQLAGPFPHAVLVDISASRTMWEWAKIYWT